jgi:hypothetical protein
MKSIFEGELLSLGSEGFEGWAWDSSKPYDPVDVEVLCNDVVIATVRADAFSLDLVKQRKGNGMHMFYAMPEFLPKATYPLKVWARIQGQEEPLNGTITIKSLSEILEVLPRSLFQDFEGYVDGIRDGFVVGWAINSAIPDEPVEVELLDGKEVIVTAMANRYRADVEQQFPGAGQSGFELALPYDLLDGRMHNLSVRVAGARHELGNSPLIFGLGTGNAVVKELLRLRQIVDSWESRERELTHDLIARFEALYSIQRDAFEREIQALKTAALGMVRQAEPEPLPPVVPAPKAETRAKPAESAAVKPPKAVPGVDELKSEALDAPEPPSAKAGGLSETAAEAHAVRAGGAAEQAEELKPLARSRGRKRG